MPRYALVCDCACPWYVTVQMRPGSYLVNASRGNVVDVPAAAEALRSKHLAGAAFDVFPSEVVFGNLLITP